MARSYEQPVVEDLTVLAFSLVMLLMPPVAVQRKPEILERVAKGEFLSSIAQSFGITHPAISQVLANDPDYRQARRDGAQKRLEEQYAKLEGAKTQLTLARARETWKAASWFAEREFPDQWGQKNQSISVVVQVSADELVGSAEDLLKSVADRQQTQRTIESQATLCNEEDASP